MKKLKFVVIILVLSCFRLLMGQRYPDYHPELNKFYSSKKLGAIVENGTTTFRLFAPRATTVTLVIFKRYDAVSGNEYRMKKDSDGVWEYTLNGELFGSYYGYRVAGPEGKGEMFNPHITIADPYARAVVTQNNYHHPAKGIVINTEYDWQGDNWITTPIRDLIIYEMHVRDMTAHPSSNVEQPGTYRGLQEKGKTGGLSYLLDLGINAVELLPIHEFANMETPYRDSTTEVYNDWNPYARNHWGYMTSYFFAPESYYASTGNMTPGAFNGINGEQVREFKDLVRTFHQHGIAVLLDVVYNHVSQYDYNPFKYIDKKYYFRLDEKDDFLSKSWCGNDFMTERPMVRRLILESVKYWMTEYHIDGFRFDLAYLLDETTCRQILTEARKINPNVYIIAEPWGDGYYPHGFSKLGWAAWNDKFRNGVKGQNPFDNPGFIFGRWERENNPTTIKRYPLGTVTAVGGLFQRPEHSINYLESHDDHTLGDFIRIATGDVSPKARIIDIDRHVKLNTRQLKLNKLAALFLFTSQGAIMMHEGQEFARSKVIVRSAVPDTNWGRIDHNSYNKDNATNYINYHHQKLNFDLYQYYRGLIALRKAHPAFRNSDLADIHFLKCNNEFGLGFHITHNSSGDNADFVVLLNGNPQQEALFTLPPGKWEVVVNGDKAGNKVLQSDISGEVKIAPTSGMVLLQFLVH